MMNTKLLVDLYKIYSPSHMETEMSRFVRNKLRKMNIPFKKNKLQIYRIRPNTPMIIAHMDQVSNKAINRIYKYEECIFGDGNIGADDKNGIWMVLMLLKRFPNISFIFSTGEEAGCDIDDILEDHKNELKHIKYCLAFDRRDGGDIIGNLNQYCNKDFEDDVAKVGTKFNYTPAIGIFSDCDMTSAFGVPSVNCSVGYYRAHTELEFTNIDELRNALDFATAVLQKLHKSYSRVEVSYGRGCYWKSYYDWYGFDYDTHEYSWYGHQGRSVRYHGYSSRGEFTNSREIFRCIVCDIGFRDEDIISDDQCPICGHSSVIIDNITDEDLKEGGGEENYGSIDKFVPTNKVVMKYEGLPGDYYCTTCDIFFDPEVGDTYIGKCPQCGGKLRTYDIYDIGGTI